MFSKWHLAFSVILRIPKKTFAYICYKDAWQSSFKHVTLESYHVWYGPCMILPAWYVIPSRVDLFWGLPNPYLRRSMTCCKATSGPRWKLSHEHTESCPVIMCTSQTLSAEVTRTVKLLVVEWFAFGGLKLMKYIIFGDYFPGKGFVWCIDIQWYTCTYFFEKNDFTKFAHFLEDVFSLSQSSSFCMRYFWLLNSIWTRTTSDGVDFIWRWFGNYSSLSLFFSINH